MESSILSDRTKNTIMNMHSNLICFIIICFLGYSCAANKAIISSGQSAHYTDIDRKGTFVIDKEIDLHGDKMILPQCERIVFVNDGCIKNGHVVLHLSTYSIEGGNGIFENVVIEPNVKTSNDIKCSLPEINARWFGAVGDAKTDNSKAIQNAIESAHSLSVPVFLPRGNYLISNHLSLYEGDILMGEYAGMLTPNHQKGATFIRYIGSEKEMVQVEGRYVTISNVVLATKSTYETNGIELLNDAGLYFCMNNVLIANTKYGVHSLLEDGKGFSECLWDRVKIWNCVRGVSIDIRQKANQYITYNCFTNVSVSNAKECGFYFHCAAINSCSFRDCLFENIGYGKVCDPQYKSNIISAIYLTNEAQQGNVIIDGGYFENIYYGKEEVSNDINIYKNSSVISVKNMVVSIRDIRLTNTATVVTSRGLDIITINNCIDNGYLGKGNSNIPVCQANTNTSVEVNGYMFSNKNKKIVQDSLSIKAKVSNMRLIDGSIK